MQRPHTICFAQFARSQLDPKRYRRSDEARIATRTNARAIASAIGLLALTTFLCLSWELGVYLPKPCLALLIPLLAIFGISLRSATDLSLMPRVFILLYSLPFLVQLGNIWEDPFIWWETPLAVEYSLNDKTVTRMLTIALVGLLGLIFGMQFASVLSGKLPDHVELGVQRKPNASNRPLGLPYFSLFMACAFLLSWMASSQETIFTTSYAAAQTQGIAFSVNFNAAFLTSYVVFIFCFADMQLDTLDVRKKLKQIALGLTISYVVIILQLLRGDRECSGLLLALAAMWITEDSDRQSKRLRTIALPAVSMFLLFLVIGFLRSEFSYSGQITAADIIAIIGRGMTYNTWTGVSLTNLGLANSFEAGMPFLHGSTYVDYLMSLPPGIMAHYVGYERPLDGPAAPNRWFDVAGGGIHPAVVPFANFGHVGVWLILALQGYLITRWDQYALSARISSRAFYGTVLTTSMLWFWYGDMNILRAIMSYGAALLMYYLCIALQGLPSTRVRER